MTPEISDQKLDLRDIILGGQDGLVNVLGVTLGIAVASGDLRVTLAGGLAATFAESFSMAAVAYTSSIVKFHAVTDALIVGFSAVLGSIVPLIPFFLLPISTAIIVAVAVSAVMLFVLGVYKAKVLGLNLGREGLKIAVIGLSAALIGYVVGLFFRVPAA
ncbi:MAG: VIT1/CCC1 transporter family protein [Patescibacteria group bacterium]